MSEIPHVLIVGAGFGGLWAARALDGAPVRVTLVDRNNFHTFYPLLYQVGAAELDAVEIAQPVRKILRGQSNVRFRMAEVQDIDLDARVVTTDGQMEHEIPYDYLVLATGSTPHFFGIRGASEYAYTLRRLEDALAQRNHILTCFERAESESDAEERRRLLRFVIVGGGPTGVEYAGALVELFKGPMVKDHPRISAGDAQVVLVEALEHLLSGMSGRLGDYALRRLRKMGVDVRLGAKVAEVTARSVHLEDGSEIPAETVVWTAGVQGEPAASRWGLPTAKGGRIPVRETLQVEGRPRVYVIGDSASVSSDGEPLPMVAPVATQQGEHAAGNILRQVEGRELEPFEYRDKGMLATIGRRSAVAEVFGRTFTGFYAWVLWLLVHIVKLIGFRNRLVVLINWTWDYFFFERAVRLILPLREARQIERGDSASPTVEMPQERAG